jgi:ABC-2 type transport system permease protein
MREACALIRSAWLTAASYRLGMLMSILGLVAVVLPLYFIANALQPTMQHTISAEATQYFGFVVLGAITFSLVSTSTSALPSALEGTIGRGTLEAILGTPARLGAVCAGLMGYGILWALLRAAILLAAAAALGAGVVWPHLPAALGLVGLTMLPYVGLGLLLSSLILVFRTAGPLSTAVLTASMFLGGVYYPSQVIPTWVQGIARVIPLTYGLRAVRRIMLKGDPVASVAGEVQVLVLMAALSLLAGGIAFALALRKARRAGTLSTY